MFRQSKETWKTLRSGPAGQRFEHLYDHHVSRRRSGFVLQELLNICFAWILILFGLAIWLVPGPGGFIAIIGLGLLAQRSLWLARRLDKIERFAWRQWQLRFARRKAADHADPKSAKSSATPVEQFAASPEQT